MQAISIGTRKSKSCCWLGPVNNHLSMHLQTQRPTAQKPPKTPRNPI